MSWRGPALRLLVLIGVASLAVSREGGGALAFLPAMGASALAVGVEQIERLRQSAWPSLAWGSVFGLTSLAVISAGLDTGASLQWLAMLLLATLVATARNLVGGVLAGVMASAGFFYVASRLQHAPLDDPLALGPALLMLAAGGLMGVAQQEGARSEVLAGEVSALGENLRYVLASVTSGVLVIEGEAGRITTLNPAAARILGVREFEAVGRPLGEGPLAPLEPLLHCPGDPTQPARQDFEFTRPDGGVVRIGSTASPLEDRAGRRLGATLVFQDVTLIRDYEERMLRQEKLAALGRRVSGIAHEFGNQLGGAKGLLELALLEDDVEEIKASLAPIKDTLAHSLTTVEHLLRFGRGTPLQRQPGVELAGVVQRALELLRAQVEAAGLEVEVQAAELPALEVDPVQFEQVVLNLVINAIHATAGRTPPRLRITLEEGSSDGRAGVVLWVEDNGPGVSPEARAQIFEPFFTTKGALGGSQIPGTGLGLSMALGVVEGHDGQLAVDASPLLEGARFRIWLPSTNGDANRPRPELA